MKRKDISGTNLPVRVIDEGIIVFKFFTTDYILIYSRIKHYL